ncbi:hypothetical protein GGQ87_000626 [Brevundimonas alba]|uniref:Uncharacterized protein n=1 Tax=Brevundimonas alba TaxID=74314 RepID=A0A7X5YI54_9CAUL|nr:hypothetical protein [Brevundimonas alba]NJC40368.1 hypothetical protein [Brevundimonas alba]
MLILLASLSLTAVQTPSDPAFEAGRDIFDAAICSTLGWESDRNQAISVLVAVEAAHPDLTEDQIMSRATEGGAAARTVFETGVTAAKADRASLAAWGEAMTLRCDALAGLYPLMLRRGPETEVRWAAQRAALEQQITD